MLNYGGPFHKVVGVFAVPAAVVAAPDTALACSIDYAAPEPCDVSVRLFAAGKELALGRIVGPSAEWKTFTAAASNGSHEADRSVNVSGVHGTGSLAVVGARFVTDDGADQHILQHGRAARLEIDYAIFQPDLHERCQVVIAIHRDGVDDVCRYITRELTFDASERQRGTIRLAIPRLTLTDGTYAITIMIAKEGYYDTHQAVFYSINPSVYCCVSRLFEISVVGSGLIGSGTRHVLEGEWSLA